MYYTRRPWDFLISCVLINVNRCLQVVVRLQIYPVIAILPGTIFNIGNHVISYAPLISFMGM